VKKKEIEKFICKKTVSIIDAMQKIDKNARGIIFVLNDDGTLYGSLTDGDIRRGIIRTGNINISIDELININPVFIYEGEEEKLNHVPYTVIPILTKEKFIKDIAIVGRKQSISTPAITILESIPVVIMAGGKGTRLYPYTKILPKPLIPIGEDPIIDHIISQFCRFGATQFKLILNYKSNMIKAYFSDRQMNYDIAFFEEKKPLGTGGGLSLLRGTVTSTFILSNCDILIRDDFEEAVRYHKEKNNSITIICSMKSYSIPYGVVEISENGNVETLKEKPKVSYFTNTGVYVVEPDILNLIPDETPIDFPDIIQRCLDSGIKVGVFPIGEKSWLDMGEMESLKDMTERI